ncbi:MAG: FeoA family protein [Candidatus Helarchaeota archaeon]
MKEISLSKVEPGNKGKISKIGGDRTYRKRLLDLGLTRGVEIEVIRNAPLGDPIEINVRKYKLSLRKDEVKDIYIILDE